MAKQSQSSDSRLLETKQQKKVKKSFFLFEKILKKKMPLPSFIGCPIEDVATPGNNPIKLKIVGKMIFM